MADLGGDAQLVVAAAQRARLQHAVQQPDEAAVPPARGQQQPLACLVLLPSQLNFSSQSCSMHCHGTPYDELMNNRFSLRMASFQRCMQAAVVYGCAHAGKQRLEQSKAPAACLSDTLILRRCL